MRNKYNNRKIRIIAARLAAVLMSVLIAAGYLPAKSAFAADAAMVNAIKASTSVDSEETIREVHKVGVGNKVYCFFVTHNVVITPEEVAALDDEKLTDEILKRAGLYMKEENCKLASHKAITPAAWKKTGGRMFLGDAEKDTSTIDALRTAVPADGAPVRLHMDLIITNETPKATSSDNSAVGTAEPGTDGTASEGATDGEGSADSEAVSKSRPWDSVAWYSTYKKSSPNSPELLYVVVATPSDAKKGEEICKEETSKDKNKKKDKTPKASPGGGDEEEMLPEYRTINMTDRSGGPLEPTLKDGDPVTLEWIEPGRRTDSEGKAGLFDHARAVPAVIAAALIIAAGVFIAIRKRRKDEEV